MSVKIEGTQELIRRIEQEYGEAKMLKAKENALRKGANYFRDTLRQNFALFKDTGASMEEMTLTQPYSVHGSTTTIKLHWRGPHERYRIIHLNEYGTVKNANPRGKGTIGRTIIATRKPYEQIIKESLRGDL